MYAAFYDADGLIHQRASGSDDAIAAVASSLKMTALEVTEEQAALPLETDYVVRDGALTKRQA
jgi:hypothetical protein